MVVVILTQENIDSINRTLMGITKKDMINGILIFGLMYLFSAIIALLMVYFWL